MSIDITKAIKTRWTAQSLGSSVTGGIHHTKAPPRTSFPYATFFEVSNAVRAQSRASRTNMFRVQIDVYTDDGNAETCADLAETVKTNLVHADNASTNPITTGSVLSIDLDGEIVTRYESDTVWRSRFTLRIMWEQARTLTPS